MMGMGCLLGFLFLIVFAFLSPRHLGVSVWRGLALLSLTTLLHIHISFPLLELMVCLDVVPKVMLRHTIP